jgi:hypothetical protein
MDTIVYGPKGSRSLVARASCPRRRCLSRPRAAPAVCPGPALRPCRSRRKEALISSALCALLPPLLQDSAESIQTHSDPPIVPREFLASDMANDPGIYTKPLDLLVFQFRKVSKGSAKSVKVDPFFFCLKVSQKWTLSQAFPGRIIQSGYGCGRGALRYRGGVTTTQVVCGIQRPPRPERPGARDKILHKLRFGGTCRGSVCPKIVLSHKSVCLVAARLCHEAPGLRPS